MKYLGWAMIAAFIIAIIGATVYSLGGRAAMGIWAVVLVCVGWLVVGIWLAARDA